MTFIFTTYNAFHNAFRIEEVTKLMRVRHALITALTLLVVGGTIIVATLPMTTTIAAASGTTASNGIPWMS